MIKNIVRTFIFFVAFFVITHILFNFQVAITHFSFKDISFALLIFGLLGCIFAIVIVLVIISPLQFLKQHFNINPLIFNIFYYFILMLVTTCILYWWGEINTHIDGMELYPSGLDFYKSLETLYQIEVLFNYIIVLASGFYFNRKTINVNSR